MQRAGLKMWLGPDSKRDATARHHSLIWRHACSPRWEQTEPPLLVEKRDDEVGLHGTLILRFCLTARSTGIRYTARTLDPANERGAGPVAHASQHSSSKNTQKRHVKMRKKRKEFGGFLRRDIRDLQLALTCACARQGAQTRRALGS